MLHKEKFGTDKYDKQAHDFLVRANCRMTITFKTVGTFDETDTHMHNVYTVRLLRDHKSYSFDFYDSHFNYRNGLRPTQYTVLASLVSYPVPENVWDFAAEFGYEIKDKASYMRAERVCKACNTQYRKLCRLFGDELMTELANIW